MDMPVHPVRRPAAVALGRTKTSPDTIRSGRSRIHPRAPRRRRQVRPLHGHQQALAGQGRQLNGFASMVTVRRKLCLQRSRKPGWRFRCRKPRPRLPSDLFGAVVEGLQLLSQKAVHLGRARRRTPSCRPRSPARSLMHAALRNPVGRLPARVRLAAHIVHPDLFRKQSANSRSSCPKMMSSGHLMRRGA